MSVELPVIGTFNTIDLLHKSHNAPFRNRNVHTRAHFCYKILHCGIFVWCIVGFVRWFYCFRMTTCSIHSRNSVVINTLRLKTLTTLCSRYFQTHFLVLNCCILIKSSLKFVPNVPFNNISALIQIMTQCRGKAIIKSNYSITMTS